MGFSLRAFAFGVFKNSKGQSCYCFWAKPWNAPTMREDVQLPRPKMHRRIVSHIVFHYFLPCFYQESFFFVTFPSVFFQDAPLTPALSLQKRDQKPSFLPGLKSTYYPLKNAYLARLNLEIHSPFSVAKSPTLHRKKVMQPRVVTRMKVWIVTWRNPVLHLYHPFPPKKKIERSESDGSGGIIKKIKH